MTEKYWKNWRKYRRKIKSLLVFGEIELVNESPRSSIFCDLLVVQVFYIWYLGGIYHIQSEIYVEAFKFFSFLSVFGVVKRGFLCIKFFFLNFQLTDAKNITKILKNNNVKESLKLTTVIWTQKTSMLRLCTIFNLISRCLWYSTVQFELNNKKH